MKEYKKYIENINTSLEELENKLHSETNIKKLQLNFKNLEKSKVELNNYIQKLKKEKSDLQEDIEYIIYNVYPKIVSKNFDREILEHIILQQFYDPNSEINIQTRSKYKIFKLNTIQKLLRNFLGPNTPYNNMMLIHDPGVGKTCTAITIAENLKNYVKMNNKRIYIVRHDEFVKQLFEIEKVKKNEASNQCTGITYLEEARKTNPINEEYLLNCIRGDAEACEKLNKNIKKEIKKYYQFNNLLKWAKTIQDEIKQNITSIMTTEEKLKTKIKVIRSLFNNNLVIIDEAHKLRDDSSNMEDQSLVISTLNDICLYSQNMKLLLLTATPMYDQPNEIITLLNFMLLNDKRPLLIEKDIFKAGNTGELQPNGIDKLLYAIKGYVSYMRGNNPEEFPLRLNANVNLSKSKMLTNYPSRTLTGEKINKGEGIQYFDLVKIELSKEQQEVLLNININEEGEQVQGVAYQAQLQAGNFIYKFLKDTENVKECYGQQGLNNITTYKGGVYSFKDPEFAKELIGEKLKKYSMKFYNVIENIKKSSGPVFIYSNFIAGGILPLTFILELNGYKRYNNDREFLNSKYKSPKILGEYVFFTGSERKSVNKYLNKRQNMVNEPVKIFICSAVANEGLNLFGYRESHILDPWYNVSSLEQTIGRCIRRGSHLHLRPEERNVTIYLYANVFTGNMKDVESYDLRVYNIVEKKAINTGKIQKVIKENAIDCAILRKNNTRLKEDYPNKVNMITSHNKSIKVDLYDKPYTVFSFYQDEISDKCSTDKYNVSKKFNYDTILDFDISLLDVEIREIIEIIKIELRKNDNLLYIDIINLINENIAIKYDKLTIKKILNYIKKFFNENKIKILNNINEISQIICFKDGLRLLSLENIKHTESIQMQTNIFDGSIKKPGVIKSKTDTITKENSYIDLDNLIEIYNKEKLKDSNYDTMTYSRLLKKLFNQYEMIINYSHQLYKQIAVSVLLNTDYDKQILLETIFNKMIYKEKLYLLKNIVSSIINGNYLNKIEKMLLNVIKYNIVYNYEIISTAKTIDVNKSILDNKDEIYGFIIADNIKINLYKYIGSSNNINKSIKTKKQYNPISDFILDKSKNQKILDARFSIMKSQNIHNIFGFISYSKSEFAHPLFKIIDYESKGMKKSVKGITCNSKLISIILEYIKKFKPNNYKYKYLTKNKNINCNNLELFMRLKSTDNIFKANEDIYYMNPEQFIIWKTKAL